MFIGLTRKLGAEPTGVPEKYFGETDMIDSGTKSPTLSTQRHIAFTLFLRLVIRTAGLLIVIKVLSGCSGTSIYQPPPGDVNPAMLRGDALFDTDGALRFLVVLCSKRPCPNKMPEEYSV